ncbi:MAG: NfeD family protein, partial [Planctomycetota bacterium]
MTTIILVFGLGLALVVAEIFVPSGGILGLLASLCLIGSLGMAFFEDPDTGLVLLAITAIVLPVLMTFGIKMFPRTPMGKRLTVKGFSFEDGAGVDRRDASLVGERGVVESTLRPSGIARIAGRRVDVVSRGGRIEAGEPVEVVEVSAGSPASIRPPRLTTSTRRPAIRAMPEGRSVDSTTPRSPTRDA